MRPAHVLFPCTQTQQTHAHTNTTNTRAYKHTHRQADLTAERTLGIEVRGCNIDLLSVVVEFAGALEALAGVIEIVVVDVLLSV